MPQYLCIVLTLLCFFSHTQAQRYTGFVGQLGQVYYTAVSDGESKYQHQAIAYLCSEFIRVNHPAYKGHVFLEFQYDSLERCGLSYDQFRAGKAETEFVRGRGVRIVFSYRQNRAERILKLLDYGLIHLNELKAARKKYYLLEPPDRLVELSVDSLTLNGVMGNALDTHISTIMSLKVFRNQGIPERDIHREYYFQNDLYTFVDFLHGDSAFFESPQVYQIISEHHMGSLIFDTDSTLYFYSREHRQLSQQVKLHHQGPISHFTHTSSDPLKRRIYFECTTAEGTRNKYIFLTDRMILIEHVEQFEDDFIRAMLNE
ncbi:hypothetical protein [Pontibacter sp. G13]|uniref:hypothetical protein n=1 Tax=Pontibacter sp. G13 TaxID=3074898 RepID=UPI00288C614F|nr:hypothetical protein [Pontibacter sp. G13]WNJ17497.1 hypothetical protein RJD25_21830 [Pontibacter sp. G13]